MVVEISDWNDLDNVRNDLTGDYVLVNDLDENTDGYAGIGDDFDPIGDGSNVFTGTFDGQGHVISDLIIDKSTDRVSLFARLDDPGATISDLGVVGDVTNHSTDSYTAGLVGQIFSDGIIENCFVSVDVSSNGDDVAGLVGSNNGSIKNCYVLGNVNGDEDVGGMCGRNPSGTIETSYSAASVSGNNSVGGFVADGNEEIGCYWDTETSGQSTSEGDATGLTTSEMQGSEAETNMDGFDFANVWETVKEGD